MIVLEKKIGVQDKAFINSKLSQSITQYLNNMQSVPQMWQMLAEKFPNVIAFNDPHHKPTQKITFKQAHELILNFASGLQYLGLKKGENTSFFSENGARWMIADQGVMMCGGANAVRGSQTSEDELIYILKHSDSSVLIVENQELLSKLQPYLINIPLKFIITLWGGKTNYITDEFVPIYSFDEIISFGKHYEYTPVNIKKEDLATLIYTSGTTGQPKGAMLMHKNLLHQINNIFDKITPAPTDVSLSILPIWHAYERALEYFLISRGTTLVYTNLKNFKQDLAKYNPTILASVPRIWESIYEGFYQNLSKQPKSKQRVLNSLLKISFVYKKACNILRRLDSQNQNPSNLDMLKAAITAASLKPIHDRADEKIYSEIRTAMGFVDFKAGISGGGAIGKIYEDFFEALGIRLIGGYGLTETSPILSVNNPSANVKYSVGQPLTNTQIKIVDTETFEELPAESKGLVLAKGDMVMKGYYKNKDATDNIISPDGWINTGDLGWLTEQGYLTLCGRFKDIIVLSNGENIEPIPIEDACLQSPFIKQIILVGQDEKALSALIVPDFDRLEHSYRNGELKNIDLTTKNVLNLFKNELNQKVKARENFRPYEKIVDFRFVTEEFSINNGLMTQTLKIKRSSIMDKYSDLIRDIYKNI
ncbi:MAG: AMP-binding protein [Candidatus Gastranaerophilales bacterium]|nr:AMP-binding protein [Candidatus Gastranaerophilales bacterium]